MKTILQYETHFCSSCKNNLITIPSSAEEQKYQIINLRTNTVFAVNAMYKIAASAAQLIHVQLHEHKNLI